MEKVQVNDMAEGGNISLEEQAAQQDAAAAEKNQQGEIAPTGERPEWLNEKFETPEDMAKAYDELSQKLGNNETNDETTTENAEETSPQETAIDDASAEWAEKGELSDGMYEKLSQVGITKDMVSMYIAGQENTQAVETTDIHNSIGGEQNYQNMVQWASENLSESEQKSYDEVVESGSVDAAKFAVQGLYSRFQMSGKAPTLMKGQTNGSGVVPYNSIAQVREAMSDSRYKQDPAFRKQVEQRIAVSNVL